MSTISLRRISKVDDDHMDSATDVMVQAFEDSPLLSPMVGGDMSLSPVLFRAYITATVVDGEAYFAEEMGDVIGVALWHGPGKGFLQSREQQAAGWDSFKERLSTPAKVWYETEYIPQLETLYAHSLPSSATQSDSYCLTLMAVHPMFQGRGVGRKLVQEGINRARKQRAPLCLHTATEDGVSIYEHWGFRVSGVKRFMTVWRDFKITVMTRESEN